MSRWFYDGPVTYASVPVVARGHFTQTWKLLALCRVTLLLLFSKTVYYLSLENNKDTHTAFNVTKPVSTSLSDEPNASKTRSLCNDKHCIDMWHSVWTINRLRFTNNLSRYFVHTLKRLNWTCRLPGYHDLPLLCRFLTTNHADGKRARRKLRQMTR